MNNQVVTINLIPDYSVPAIVRLSQYDVERPIVFRVLDGNVPAAFPSGATATCVGTKPSGLGFQVIGTIGLGGTVTFSTFLGMTQESGMIPAEIRFTTNEYAGHPATDIGTANFTLAIEPSPHVDGTTDGSTEEARTVLEQAQSAADAAAESAEEAAEAAAAVGDKYSAPIPASTVSAMTDHDKVYLYTGNETGYEYGNWYFWNGTAWTSGGAYGTGVEVYVDGTSLVINTNVQDGNEVSY